MKFKQVEMKNTFLIFLTFVLIAGCTQSKNSNQNSIKSSESTPKYSTEDYLVDISVIDNKANVYINDSLIYTSGTVDGNPEVNIQIDLSSLITTGEKTLKIELLNGLEPYHAQDDAKWGLDYDLVVGGEIVDFVSEHGEDNTIGKVFEYNYQFMDGVLELIELD